jgi:hypothetical protein
MGKIIPQILETESIDRPSQEIKDDLFFILAGNYTSANATRITPLYDEEIGLWEEMDHKYRLRNDAIK